MSTIISFKGYFNQSFDFESIPDEGYFRNRLSTLNLISTFFCFFLIMTFNVKWILLLIVKNLSQNLPPTK